MTIDSFERRVLRGLSEKLLDPDLVAAYVEEYRATWALEAKRGRKDRSRVERRKADAESRIGRYIAALGDGRLSVDDVVGPVADAKEEKARCEAELAEIAAEKVVALHPGLAGVYRKRIAALTESLALDDQEAARQAVRALIDRIVVTPKVGTIGTAIEVHGLLSSIVAVAGGKLPDCTATLVPLGRVGRASTLLKIAV